MYKNLRDKIIYYFFIFLMSDNLNSLLLNALHKILDRQYLTIHKELQNSKITILLNVKPIPIPNPRRIVWEFDEIWDSTDEQDIDWFINDKNEEVLNKNTKYPILKVVDEHPLDNLNNLNNDGRLIPEEEITEDEELIENKDETQQKHIQYNMNKTVNINQENIKKNINKSNIQTEPEPEIHYQNNKENSTMRNLLHFADKIFKKNQTVQNKNTEVLFDY